MPQLNREGRIWDEIDFHVLFSLVVTCDASTSACIRSLILPQKQIETKRSVSTSARIKIIFFLVKTRKSKCKLNVTLSSGNQRRRKHKHNWDAIFTPLKLAQVIWSQPRLVPRVSILLLRRQRREGRETLGRRLIWPDIRSTCAWATFCFHVHYFDASTGAGIKRKKKKIAFTCTYAYVRTCVASENKAFMLVPMPGLRF